MTRSLPTYDVACLALAQCDRDEAVAAASLGITRAQLQCALQNCPQEDAAVAADWRSSKAFASDELGMRGYPRPILEAMHHLASLGLVEERMEQRTEGAHGRAYYFRWTGGVAQREEALAALGRFREAKKLRRDTAAASTQGTQAPVAVERT